MVEVDDRDIDKLVDFVGEINNKAEQKSKKKKKKSQTKIVSNEDEVEEEKNGVNDENVMNMADRVKVIDTSVNVVKVKNKNNSIGVEKEQVGNDAQDFQVVTRRRGRKNSQSNSISQKSDSSDAHTPKLIKTITRTKSLSESSNSSSSKLRNISGSNKQRNISGNAKKTVAEPKGLKQ